MNKKAYLTAGICGLGCVAVAVTVWMVFIDICSAVAGETAVGFFAVLLMDIFFLLPGFMAGGGITLVITGLTLSHFFVNRNNINVAIIISLGIFELILTVVSIILFATCLILTKWSTLFLILALICLACGIATIVFAAKTIKHQPIDNI